MRVAMSYIVVAELAVRRCLLSINRQMLYVDTACELGTGFIIHLFSYHHYSSFMICVPYCILRVASRL